FSYEQVSALYRGADAQEAPGSADSTRGSTQATPAGVPKKVPARRAAVVKPRVESSEPGAPGATGEAPPVTPDVLALLLRMRVLGQSADKPERQAVHYALLRSLKQAVYSPYEEEHYALASQNYCHFTSPIRRYPDLTVHRLLGQWLRDGRAGSDVTELAAVGEHCSRMERRAEAAERELVKLRLLTYLSERLGAEFGAVI